MASSWKHADRFADDALDELAAAGWPSRSREAVAEWFALSPSERAEAQEALNVVVPRQGQRPPFPVDLLYVPSSGGSLPTAGPTSAQAWLASLQPKPGEPLMVFPATGARYERESISSMRGVGGFETEAVIGSDPAPIAANVIVEPNVLRVITHFGRTGDGKQPGLGHSVHFLVPLRSVRRIELSADDSARDVGNGSRRNRPSREREIRISFNDGWRLCAVRVETKTGERGIIEADQHLLIETMLAAVAGAQGVATPELDLRSQTDQVAEFDRAVGFGVAAPSWPECQTAAPGITSARRVAMSGSIDDKGHDHGNGDAAC